MMPMHFMNQNGDTVHSVHFELWQYAVKTQVAVYASQDINNVLNTCHNILIISSSMRIALNSFIHSFIHYKHLYSASSSGATQTQPQHDQIKPP